MKKQSYYGYDTIIKLDLQQQLVFRFNVFVSFFAACIQVIIYQKLWISLYNGSASFYDTTLSQVIAYSTLCVVFRGTYSNILIDMVAAEIKTGNIIYHLSRPLKYIYFLFFKTTGAVVSKIILSVFPMLLVSIFILKIKLPLSFFIWSCFIISWVLGMIIAFLIDFLFSLLGFLTTGMDGIYFAKTSLIAILSGAVIPLWILPNGIEKVVSLLPFAGINYLPLTIIIGKTDTNRIVEIFLLQVLWVMILFFISNYLYSALVKKIAIQGG